jgi:hypothetical protein
MAHKTIIGPFIFAALLGALETIVAAPPQVTADRHTVSVAVEDQTLHVSLADAVLTLESPQGGVVMGPALQLGTSWTRPSRAESKPRISKSADRVTVEITYPVPEQRQFTMKLEAYAGTAAVFVTSRLEVLADPRGQYYFWAMNFSPLHHVSPGQHGLERIDFDGNAKEGKTIPWNRWWFCGSERGGLAVFPTNCGGRSPGQQGNMFLHALPRSQLLAPGDSLTARFGLAGAKDAAAVEKLWRAVQARHIPTVTPWTDGDPPKDSYGKPAPKWLRDAEICNFYYRPVAQWTDAVVQKSLKRFPLIVGSTPDKAALEKCHKAGVRVLHYVMYNCLLDTAMQVRGGAPVYSEWLEAGDCESRDLKNHPDWVCIDAQGKIQKDAWGQAHHHPGLLNTCLHRKGLRDAAVRHVRLLMEMGFDGVFIDLAGPTVECYGPKFGKHKHDSPHKSNTEAWEDVMRAVYDTVKQYGDDRIVMQNTCTGIMPSHWAYCDAQLIEAYPYNGDSNDLTATWPELWWNGNGHAQAVAHGKIPVVMPYFERLSAQNTSRSAAISLAYARLFGFLWADAFTLQDIGGNYDRADALYRLRLGHPTAALQWSGGALSRSFEQGTVTLDPVGGAVLPNVPHDAKK